MKIFKPQDIRKIDELCVQKYKIPSLLLMEHAGIKIVEEIQKSFNIKAKILIITGKGNNGGDGLVCARLLYNLGYNVNVLLLSHSLNGDPQTNLDILYSLGIKIHDPAELEPELELDQLLLWSDVVVDAIFGVGFSGELDAYYINIFKRINSCGKYIISVDVPSGNIIQANKTITLGCIKDTLLFPPGRQKAGEVVVADIGIPKKIIDEYPTSTYLLTPEKVSNLLPIRVDDSHKGTYGTGIIIGGSIGMSGAVILSAKAALRSGIGLLYTIVSEALLNVIEGNCFEAITIPIPKELGQLEKYLKKTNSILIGPGLSTDNTKGIFMNFIENYNGKMVIDGDGLNLVSNLRLHHILNENHVLTPHPKEMARLTGCTVEEIVRDPIKAAREFSVKYQCTLVLKGSTTCIGTKDGLVYVNITGNNGLATGGSGDVLGGIIMSFMAQGLSCESSAMLGVYLLGITADIIAKEKGHHSLLPSDIPENLYKGFQKLLKRGDCLC